MEELRDQIRQECEEAVENGKLPRIDVELKHVYVEEFYKILERERFIKSSKPVLDLLVEMGEVERVRRHPGPCRVKGWLSNIS